MADRPELNVWWCIQARIAIGLQVTPRRDDREICTNIGNAVIRNGPDTLSEQVQVDKPPHDLWERLHEAAEIESATRSGEPGLLFAIAKEEADPVVHFVDRRTRRRPPDDTSPVLPRSGGWACQRASSYDL